MCMQITLNGLRNLCLYVYEHAYICLCTHTYFYVTMAIKEKGVMDLRENEGLHRGWREKSECKAIM